MPILISPIDTFFILKVLFRLKVRLSLLLFATGKVIEVVTILLAKLCPCVMIVENIVSAIKIMQCLILKSIIYRRIDEKRMKLY